MIACDSFKGSLSSLQAGEAARKGVLLADAGADVTVVPIADGGEGTVEAISQCTDGSLTDEEVKDPLGHAVSARYFGAGDLAFIEMAQASGLTLVAPERRNPLLTSSYGTGQLIRHALDSGYRTIAVGLGGSATNDAGTGMLRALGYRFLDARGRVIEVCGGGMLSQIERIDTSGRHPAIDDAHFTVACDVTNPLTGSNGASLVFGPQKGADTLMALELDRSLTHFADLCRHTFGSHFASEPGTGAAGGLGFAFRQFMGAKLQSGIELVLSVINFSTILRGADLVITGEGSIDSQTAMGKAITGVMRHASSTGIPVVAIGGRVDPGARRHLHKLGFEALLQVTPESMPLAEAMRQDIAARNISTTLSRYLSSRNKT